MRWFSKMLLVFGLALSVNCGGPNDAEAPKGNQMPNKSIQRVQEEHTDHLMSIPGVVGTAIGEADGRPCIKVLVSQKTAEIEKGVPKSLEGYPVVIEVTGEFKALDQDS
ncbi:MAG: hypothetical protein L0Z48_05485 [candidate division Zixibacteria bacterium]|nr:hypothetical protein [candidate division Zixibacteria bacterium]MCI0595977.1 hypothetical protein [candidate division Zixibacteria bacterium]